MFATLGVYRGPWKAAATVILALAIGVSIAHTEWIIIVTLLALPIFFIRPREFALGSYAFLLPFDSISGIGPAGRTLTWIVGIAAAVVLVGTALLNKRITCPPRYALWWALFVLWGGATIVWALEGQSAATKITTSLSLLVFYIAVLCSNLTSKEVRYISLFVVAGGCAAAIYAVVQFYAGTFYHGDIRASLIAGERAADPNFFAASLLLPFSLVLNGFLDARRWTAKLISLSATGMITFGILVTMSRGALVAVGVMLLFYVYFHRTRIILVPVSILVIFVLLLPSVFFTRLQQAAATGGAGRLSVWRVGLVALQHYWLAGAGINNFPYAYREYLGSAPMFRNFYMSAAHNIYLEIAVETGIVGLMFFLAAIVGQLRVANELRRTLSPYLDRRIIPYQAACCAILTAGFFIDILWEKWFWFAWILLAASVQTLQGARLESLTHEASEYSVEDGRFLAAPHQKT